ncbi:hypothetical protein M514_04282 [Trichuris suis]|uniref:Uncharacterized protein n=1 Tax=Trichuris suis TaxID=68888 RepID=A0A085NQH2_9BILA|nr:hypothetical protein M513_04282 [Trichuris suis]KFD71718.1 hypothetical protein M514_04282 [Trichuris suis]
MDDGLQTVRTSRSLWDLLYVLFFVAHAHFSMRFAVFSIGRVSSYQWQRLPPLIAAVLFELPNIRLMVVMQKHLEKDLTIPSSLAISRNSIVNKRGTSRNSAPIGRALIPANGNLLVHLIFHLTMPNARGWHCMEVGLAIAINCHLHDFVYGYCIPLASDKGVLGMQPRDPFAFRRRDPFIFIAYLDVFVIR